MDQIVQDVTPHTYIVKEISLFEWQMAWIVYFKEKQNAK